MKRGDYRKESRYFANGIFFHFIQFVFFHDLDSTQAWSFAEALKQTIDDAYEQYCGRYL